MAETQDPVAQEVALAIAASRSIHKVADALMDRAHAQLQAGEVSLDQYYALSEQYQALVGQANTIALQADRLVGRALQPQLAQIAALTADLEAGVRKLLRVQDILGLSAKIAVAVAAVALAVATPSPGTLASAVIALTDAVSGVAAEARKAGVD